MKDLRIQSEEWLSELRDNQWNEKTNSYEKDTITNRCNLLDPDMIALQNTSLVSNL